MIDAVPHGGALGLAMRRHGGSAGEWLDLSTGINPVPAPLPAFAAADWGRLPDLPALEACLAAARRAYGLQGGAALVAAPGVQAIIQLLPALRPGLPAAVLSPTYGEYAHVFRTLGAGAAEVRDVPALAAHDVAVVVNPNNPDGRRLDPGLLEDIARRLAARGGLLVVDEAFGDIAPELSVAGLAGAPGLLVLKSFGKFSGLAGLRLGFAAGHPADIAVLSARLGPWAVSGPALAAGTHVLGDAGLCAGLRQSILAMAALQRAVLADAGLDVVADAGLFHLVAHDDAASLHEGLARQRILTRVFAGRPRWLRLGLCAGGPERARLASALNACLA